MTFRNKQWMYSYRRPDLLQFFISYWRVRCPSGLNSKRMFRSMTRWRQMPLSNCAHTYNSQFCQRIMWFLCLWKLIGYFGVPNCTSYPSKSLSSKTQRGFVLFQPRFEAAPLLGSGCELSISLLQFGKPLFSLQPQVFENRQRAVI